jgi:putative spermidine/putrescine transport system ATP-binding protein
MKTFYGEPVVFNNVFKRYGSTLAVDNFNLEIKKSEFLTLLGPSGSGKTTILNMIAGFISQDEGNIKIGSESVHNLPTEKRNVGMVFQNYSLFPHMNIFENVAFPLKMRNYEKNTTKEKVNFALNLVRLDNFETRMPNELSGGQRQRVAFARAIVFEPKVLLMDEPLGALDLKLRERMQIEIKRYHKEIGCTVIYVTHDQGEALTLSDRIVIMNEGKIVQIDNPNDIYDKPNSKFSATFIGETNIFEVSNKNRNNENYIKFTNIETNREDYSVKQKLSSNENKMFISVRPEKFKIHEDNSDPGDENLVTLSLIINETIFLGDIIKYICLGDNKNEITLKIARNNLNKTFNNNENIKVSFDLKDAIFLDH